MKTSKTDYTLPKPCILCNGPVRAANQEEFDKIMSMTGGEYSEVACYPCCVRGRLLRNQQQAIQAMYARLSLWRDGYQPGDLKATAKHFCDELERCGLIVIERAHPYDCEYEECGDAEDTRMQDRITYCQEIGLL